MTPSWFRAAAIRHGDWKLLTKGPDSRGQQVGYRWARPIGSPAKQLVRYFNLEGGSRGNHRCFEGNIPRRVAELKKRMEAFEAELKKNTRPIGRITEVPEDVKRKLEKSDKKKK
jgi:hypothetical protein